MIKKGPWIRGFFNFSISLTYLTAVTKKEIRLGIMRDAKN